MNNITFLLRPAILLLGFLISINTFSQVPIASYDFNSGLQGWTTGANANRGTGSQSCDSSPHLWVYWNKAGSIVTSPAIDLTSYVSIDYSFCLTSSNLTGTDGFILQYFDGSSWVNVKTYTQGTDFIDNYTNNSLTINLDSATYTFASNSQFRFQGDNNKGSEYCHFDDVVIEGYLPAPEIDVFGNSQPIASGDVTPSTTDDTDYGNISLGVPTAHTFTIENNGNATLNIASVTLGGVNPGDFSISSSPSATVAASGSTTFDVTFTSTVLGPRSAIVTINNDDSDESSYTFTVQGTATPPQPEINIQGNGVDIADGETVTSATDDTNFGNVNQGSSVAHTFTIQNIGAANLTIGSTVTLTNGTDFSVTTQPATTTVAASGSTTFIITFAPTSSGDFTDLVTITNDDSDENPYTFSISGTSYLIEPSGLWSYLDDGSDQGTAWQTADVSPSGANWATGNAQLGYGDGDEVTVVSYGSDAANKYPTTYFRRSFTASAGDVANTTLNLNAIVDDGMVVYINGTEVWRDNMPTGTILYNTYAAGTGSDANNWISLNVANLVVLGTNEVAVEIHQASASSSDISFDFFMYTSNEYIFIPPTQPDNDFDTVADYKDTDDDNDGITDLLEGCFSGQFEDLNSDPYGAGSEESLLSDFPFTQTLDDGNTIDYSITGTFNNITSYDAGDHGWSIRTRGPGTSGTLTLDFGTNVENLSFRLVDFDEDETYTINAYDETNTLIDLITNVNIYYLGSYITQSGNTVTDSTNGSSTNHNGEDINSDQWGTAYFYFPNVTVSRIEFIIDQPIGSSIRIAALEYCNQDTDGDSIEDYHDSDSDNDGIPDLVEGGGTDTDGNGIIDDLTDTDSDGIADLLDSDVSNYNAQEVTKLLPYLDFDGDGVYNNIDLDSDNDGIADIIEIGEPDINGDGQIDGFTDANLDGYHDSYDGISSRLITGSDAGADGFPDTYPNSNYDSTGYPNFLDIDSDDDGITDNTEAQATGSYIVYVATDTDGDGIANIFDASGSFGGAGVTPIDTDIDGTPDYLDTDSDNAEESDLIEGHDTNGDGVVNGSDSPSADTGLFTGVDSDNDGLDDGFDNNDSAFNATNGSLQPTSHPIVDGGSDRDWRSSVAAIDFDGVDDHIDYGDEHEFTTAFSLEAWVLQETTVTTGTILAKSNAKAGNEKGYRLVLNNSYPNLKWYDNSSVLRVNITSSYPITNNRWYHIAATYDGTTAKLFIDGIQVASSTPAANPGYSTEKFLIGATYDSDTPTSPKHYFNGFIDEVRIWNVGLSATQLREMMNQEIEESTTDLGSGTLVKGSVLPFDISGGLLWDDLKGYYPMTDDSADDKSSNTKNGSPKNITTEELQTAPLPYTTKANGVWTDNSATTPWTLGDSVWDEPNGLGVDGTPIDWNIVVSSHNVSSGNKDITVLGLITDTPSTVLTIADPTDSQDETNSGQGLRITQYLKMDGDIDLVGESQLLQDEGSILDVSSAGIIERDQQGTRDLFTYNYWSSPVGLSNITTNNNSFSFTNNILKDGTNSALPSNITFLSSGYNGSSGSPIGIADYWIWKFANKTGDDYSQWQHVRSSGTINAGEGFTMKGVANTGGAITQQQNYVFEGKPNNGDISLTVTAGNEYLVGNPYPSAIDAQEFILDNLGVPDGGRNTNGNIINGALYFWDHFASNTHALSEYEGGYATYTLIGGTAAISNDIRINANGGVGTKIPERYIPVSQGFFVSAILDASLVGLTQPVVGGDILFKNSQRVFKREIVSGSDTGSIFLRSPGMIDSRDLPTKEDGDSRQKIRLMFDSADGYHRQLLVGVDKENGSNSFDLGYDAPLIENNKEDMFWHFKNKNFIIQAVNNFRIGQVLPLGVRTNKEGEITIRIDELYNINEDTNIYLHDKALEIYHDLKESDFKVNLNVGEFMNRFEITFAENALDITLDPEVTEDLEETVVLDNTVDPVNIADEENELEGIYNSDNLNILFSNTTKNIVLFNHNLFDIKSMEMLNVLGQSVLRIDEISNTNYNEFKTRNLNPGSYIIKLETEEGTITKKVLVQ